jgi:hypothetical protein
MKERILVLYVHDSWDHPVGHRLFSIDPDHGQLNEEDC